MSTLPKPQSALPEMVEDSQVGVLEEWRDILNTDGLYQLSNFGRVKSFVFRKYGENGMIRKLNISKKGYPIIRFLGKTYIVHILVYKTFIGEIPKGMQVNHEDGIKTNNHVSNLNLLTNLENIRHSWRIGLRNMNHKKKRVHQIDLNGELIKTWESEAEVCRELGISTQCVGRCCIGKGKTSHGYVWRFAY